MEITIVREMNKKIITCNMFTRIYIMFLILRRDRMYNCTTF